jgi:hypothetical protein
METKVKGKIEKGKEKIKQTIPVNATEEKNQP